MAVSTLNDLVLLAKYSVTRSIARSLRWRYCELTTDIGLQLRGLSATAAAELLVSAVPLHFSIVPPSYEARAQESARICAARYPLSHCFYGATDWHWWVWCFV